MNEQYESNNNIQELNKHISAHFKKLKGLDKIEENDEDTSTNYNESICQLNKKPNKIIQI